LSLSAGSTRVSITASGLATRRPTIATACAPANGSAISIDSVSASKIQTLMEPYPGVYGASPPRAMRSTRARFLKKLAWRCIEPTCPSEGTVLDPFIGSGTTSVVALRLGRLVIGIDVSELYLARARERLRDIVPIDQSGELHDRNDSNA
jgi:DNA methylase